MKSKTPYTVVYLPPEQTKCHKCDGVSFVPVVKDDKEYAKCVSCGCLIEATHYEHMLDCEYDACSVKLVESSKNNAKKK